MAKLGPRNLLEVARHCGIPFTTVYHRIAQIEAKSKQIAILIPSVARIGMVRLVVLAAASAGEEEGVTKAFKIPNLWRAIEPCEGAFTHHTVQIVPRTLLKQFKEFVAKMSEMNMIKNYRILLTSDSVPNFPDFSSYNTGTNEWTFDWEGWLRELNDTQPPNRTIADPEASVVEVDKTDLQIIENLELNARANFTDIARDVQVSPQTVKYRLDSKLLPSGLVKAFQFDVVPYPLEMAAPHEVMLQFTSSEAMNRFFSLAEKLFFVISISKVLHQNALIVRSYTLHTQVPKMFAFFSQMVRSGHIESYSAARLHFSTREMQTISSELFNDQTKEWTWNADDYLRELKSIHEEIEGQYAQHHLRPS
ncbi:MAG: AsnC family transcriptional regulator [Candidatus Bathyarchaeia archaeon]|jgi:DNA-binding Lrp family transcriptional regulator